MYNKLIEFFKSLFMGISNMQNTKELQDTIVKHLQKYGKNDKCPVCGNNKWVLPNTQAIIPSLIGNSINIGKGFPVVILLCNNCGYLLSLSSIFIKRKLSENNENTKK